MGEDEATETVATDREVISLLEMSLINCLQWIKDAPVDYDGLRRWIVGQGEQVLAVAKRAREE